MSFSAELTRARDAAGLSQRAAADVLHQLGVTVSERSLAGYERNEREPDLSKQRAILSALESFAHSGVRPDPSGSTVPQLIRDPVYDIEAGAGDGGFLVKENPTGFVDPPYAMSSPSRRVAWVGVRGDSMGSRYAKGTVIPVLLFDTPPRDVREDDVYLIRIEGAVQVKRLQRLSGGRIRIISDNKRYPVEELKLDDGVDFEVIGRVLA